MRRCEPLHVFLLSLVACILMSIYRVILPMLNLKIFVQTIAPLVDSVQQAEALALLLAV